MLYPPFIYTNISRPKQEIMKREVLYQNHPKFIQHVSCNLYASTLCRWKLVGVGVSVKVKLLMR